MRKFFKNIAVFIKGLQCSDDARKKRWFVGSAAVAMILVIGLWALYLNFTIPDFNRGAKSDSADNKESFFGVFARGLGVISAGIGEKGENLAGNLSRGIDALKEQTKKSNEVEIKNNDPTSFFKNMESVPTGKFPLVK